QRHFYDLTRKFYLLGRDAMLAELPSAPSSRICELGCGTGRNLIRLARRRPEARLYGIDVSRAMLATAAARVRAAGLERRIRLAEAPAGRVDPRPLSGQRGGADRVDPVHSSYGRA